MLWGPYRMRHSTRVTSVRSSTVCCCWLAPQHGSIWKENRHLWFVLTNQSKLTDVRILPYLEFYNYFFLGKYEYLLLISWRNFIKATRMDAYFGNLSTLHKIKEILVNIKMTKYFTPINNLTIKYIHVTLLSYSTAPFMYVCVCVYIYIYIYIYIYTHTHIHIYRYIFLEKYSYNENS
jgi:hypothetical protein